MKTIYKAMIAFIAISMMVSGVSAFDFQRDYGNEDIDFNQARPYSDTGIEYHDTITQSHGGIQVDEFTPNQPTQNGGEIHGTEFVGSQSTTMKPSNYQAPIAFIGYVMPDYIQPAIRLK